MTFGDQLWMKALARVAASEGPQAIDYLHLDGPAAGQIQRGLLFLAGDEAQFCLAEPGDPRPSEFTSKSGSGLTLSIWQRKR